MRTISATAAAAAAITGLAALTPAQAAPLHSQHFNITGLSGATFQAEHQLPGGYWTAQWKVQGHTVKVAALPGSTVVLKQTHGKVSAQVNTPNLKTTFHGDGRAAAFGYMASGASVIANAEAVGFTPAQAAKIAASAAPKGRIMPLDTSVGGIIQSPCASVSGDAGNAWGQTCDIQKMLENDGGGNWYVGDQVTGSGNDPDWYASLSGLAADINYGGGNSMKQWDPSGYRDAGQCGTLSTSASWNGIGVSASSPLCPDHIDIDGRATAQNYGSHWSGHDTGNRTEGVASSDVVYSPGNASSNPGLTVSIWWY
ncbi:hypothetical protein [Streptacidiphilus sp. MAP12-20]|uniref:hypothetical protein n=1 Tax=Streptacidiphilus sp. MAP12-20 TaxID=3156299 RepID=UPI0035198BFB